MACTCIKWGKRNCPPDFRCLKYTSWRVQGSRSIQSGKDNCQAYISKIYDNKEKVVKCKIISSEEVALVPWEDFQVYCSYHDKNEYDIIKQIDPSNYYSMQVADYILGNEDRHAPVDFDRVLR